MSIEGVERKIWHILYGYITTQGLAEKLKEAFEEDRLEGWMTDYRPMTRPSSTSLKVLILFYQ